MASDADLARMAAVNRGFWDELAGVHLAPGGYDLARLRRGEGWLNQPVERELAATAGPLAGRRAIHLQCHIGADTLVLAQRGAAVVGVDFSPESIRIARGLAGELGLAERARFVECDLYAAPEAVGAAAGFDLAYVTWGALNWLPDIGGWARVVAHFLAPGGRLYLAEGHPAAFVFDDRVPDADGRPGWFAPYLEPGPTECEQSSDYANPAARLASERTFEWLHPLGAVVSALIDAGLAIRFLHEHDAVPWPMFACLVRGEDGMYRWPDRPWLPLSYSLAAEKPAGG